MKKLHMFNKANYESNNIFCDTQWNYVITDECYPDVA